ncbi:tRNA (guanosine(37)-N1)-methyltransferase TrmD [Nocardioides sp. TF02-7]|uniref:tRNA (guanosine(37)-N1)-methyltransferase TrmD n=1 Tax=Nocardioides sp. TF02-7 TaxID=2917724 RepID=UPI001F066509|nr:tRNA (guanosine(37)-N1)-methyltransferase TrmD [Nocardioides sp. TF02-7]UMG93032.1 tRNA (guanosine(37)-N1)-methyltransferase TrmD [Nocardioides sp. TF02-7]
MRIDYLTIFPDYLAPLGLSLPGRAAADGLVEFHVHDLRTWTHDRHRTVDDTPYGGGAGMVLKPEPFGEALDELAVDGATVVVPTPAGRPFTQAAARDLATRERLVFLCGRYEGIDQRVLDHVAARAELVEVSLGDYVLNGGEVAALAVTEAVVRLLPGFMGNAASLLEESHEDGLLEYPVYTKPQSWRGHEVPAVLRSGDHAAVAAWRREQALHRTVERRPDLLPPSLLDDGTPDRAGGAGRRRRAAHPAAGLLGVGGGGQRPTRHRRHPRDRRRRARLAGGVGNLRRPSGRPAGRCCPGPPRGRHLGDRPDHGGP